MITVSLLSEGRDILSILISLPSVFVHSCLGEEPGGGVLQAELLFPCSFS